MTPYHFFAPCPRGLELILATKLEKLGTFSAQTSDGGVKFQGSWHTCYRTNLSVAGFAEVVVLKQGNILEISAAASTGILITNPPYGKRVGEQKKLAELYPKLRDVLKKKLIGWNTHFFTGDTLFQKLIRLAASCRIPLFNAALECRLLEYNMVAGGMRRMKKVGITQGSNLTSTASQNL